MERLLAPASAAVLRLRPNRPGKQMDEQLHRSVRSHSFAAQLVYAAEAGGLKILDMESMRGHYAETLLH